jgi:maltooligosyltrehalose trehalohydrolase
MTMFTVWAPGAARVELDLAGRRIPMVDDGAGWWRATHDSAGPGTDYAFVVDGRGPFPDPRSPWQPRGVHGPSRVVDHGSFHWTDADWTAPPLANAVLYELHIGTFTPDGTFDAAIAKFDHLRRLGVTHLQVMPVAAFPGTRGWGYDGVALFAPHDPYGGPEGLRRFVDAAHHAGLAVLLDVVYNHLGPSGNYLSQFGLYFTRRYTTPWGEAVNVDGRGSDEVRRFMIDNACHWLTHYHVDGLRLDAIHAIVDRSAMHLLEEMATAVAALETRLGRRLVLIAESSLNDPRIVRARDAGGHGIHAQWSDDFHHALHAVLTGERAGYYADFGTIADLGKALTQAFVLDGRYSSYRQRRHGRPATGIPGDRFIGYLQTHDQVGNRAAGERSAALMSLGLLQVGAALVLTAPFVPMLFQGEEWGAATPFQYFTEHAEPELARAVREGRRREFASFGWPEARVPDPQDPMTFNRSRLDWSEPTRAPHDALLEWHRQLIALRRATPDLHDGNLAAVRVHADEASRSLVMVRGRVVVACNLGARTLHLETGGPTRLLLASTAGGEVGEAWCAIPAESVMVLHGT